MTQYRIRILFVIMILTVDSSSRKSVSLITTLAEVYETQADTNRIRTPTILTKSHVNAPETDKSPLGRPKKGRKRSYGGYTREERKYINLSYVNSRNQMIDPN